MKAYRFFIPLLFIVLKIETSFAEWLRASVTEESTLGNFVRTAIGIADNLPEDEWAIKKFKNEGTKQIDRPGVKNLKRSIYAYQFYVNNTYVEETIKDKERYPTLTDLLTEERVKDLIKNRVKLLKSLQQHITGMALQVFGFNEAHGFKLKKIKVSLCLILPTSAKVRCEQVKIAVNGGWRRMISSKGGNLRGAKNESERKQQGEVNQVKDITQISDGNKGNQSDVNGGKKEEEKKEDEADADEEYVADVHEDDEIRTEGPPQELEWVNVTPSNCRAGYDVGCYKNCTECKNSQ